MERWAQALIDKAWITGFELSEGHEFYDYRLVWNLKSMGWAGGPTGQFSLRASKVALNLKSRGWAAGLASKLSSG